MACVSIELIQDGATPMYIAAQNGHLDVVKHLLSVGADKDKAKTVIRFGMSVHTNAHERTSLRSAVLNACVRGGLLLLISSLGGHEIITKLITVSFARTQVRSLVSRERHASTNARARTTCRQSSPRAVMHACVCTCIRICCVLPLPLAVDTQIISITSITHNCTNRPRPAFPRTHAAASTQQTTHIYV